MFNDLDQILIPTQKEGQWMPVFVLNFVIMANINAATVQTIRNIHGESSGIEGEGVRLGC